MGHEPLEPSGVPEDDQQRAELELQRRYHAGDPLACDRLWHRHEKTFQSQANRWTGGDADDSHDAVEDLRIKLQRPDIQAKYDPGRKWRTWASTMLRRIIIDRYRTPRAQARMLEVRPALGPNEVATDEADDPLARLIAEERAAIVRACIDERPNELAEALSLWVLHGLTLEVIAKRQGCSITTAKRRADKASELLRKCVMKRGIGGHDHA